MVTKSFKNTLKHRNHLKCKFAVKKAIFLGLMLFSLVSCQNTTTNNTSSEKPVESENKNVGELCVRLILPGDAARQIEKFAPDLEPVRLSSVILIGKKDGGETFSKNYPYSKNTWNCYYSTGYISTGEWNLTVDVLDENGFAVFSGNEYITIKKMFQNSFSITLFRNRDIGTGTFVLNLNNEGSELSETEPPFITMHRLDSEEYPVVETPCFTDGSTKFTTVLNSGDYLVTVKFTSKNGNVGYFVNTCLIAPDKITEGTINLIYNDFSNIWQWE